MVYKTKKMSASLSRSTAGAATSSLATGGTGSHHHHRKHRSRSTPRYADLEKPKKKKHLSGATSLVSIPNTIKLSMLNSGLISFGKWLSFYFYSNSRKLV